MPSETLEDRRSSYGKGDLIAEKYLLEELLEEGGMGTVWLGRNLDLDVAVAIKVARFDPAHPEVAARLTREARLEARLEHRAIVRVFDCGETDGGDPFVVMELLEGLSLFSALELAAPLSVSMAVRILLPIIDGLSVAHAKGIVHRDIKPGNIFLARATGHIQPKVLDFGVAKLSGWNPNPRITVEGTIVGSPAYMAPEQARGLDDVDHRADVWAICAVLYEAISKSLPFRGDNYNAILRSIVEDEPMPPPNCRGAMADLWPILARGLSKDREHRYQSMRELGIALAQFLSRLGVTDDFCGDSLATTWARPSISDRPRQAPSSPPHDAASSARRDGRILREADSTLAQAASAPDPGPTSTSSFAAPIAGGARRDRRSMILSSLAVVAALGILVLTVRKTSDAAFRASAAASWKIDPAPVQAVESSPLANVVPSAVAPTASASVTPPVPAGVPLSSLRLAADSVGERNGAAHKRPPTTNVPRHPAPSSAPRSSPPRAQDRDWQLLGLKDPY